MIRIKEHYENVVREELAVSGSSCNVHERPSISGISLHIGLKNFRFDGYLVAPRLVLQELSLGSRSKLSVSRSSEPEFGLRKGAVVGVHSSIWNRSSIYHCRDRRVWNLAGLEDRTFSGWRYRTNIGGFVGVRSPVPFFEYNDLPNKDLAIDGINTSGVLDWVFKFDRELDTKTNIRLLQGLSLPFEEPMGSKGKRMFRSKTTRKFMSKLRKQRMKQRRS